MNRILYFAYGSNMNLDQMAVRCPDAVAACTVQLDGYRLAFRSNGSKVGVATLLPDSKSTVSGVLWRISDMDESRLDHYEGFPYLYGKKEVIVTDRAGTRHQVMAYVMNPPFRESPAMPSPAYLDGILTGCKQNGVDRWNVLKAVRRTRQELDVSRSEVKRAVPTQER